MQLDCPRCGRVLEYSGKRPSFCAYCGKPLPVPLEATKSLDPEAATMPPCEAAAGAGVPECLGGYRLVRPLGTGGMGTVYEAEEEGTGRRVALKLIAQEYTGSEETAARFRQEGLLASQVVHPRCVFVHKADEDAGRPYIVMELMPGQTLQDLVQDKGPLAVEDAVMKILDVIDGLQEAHRLGIIHRDVKPSNCFLDTSSRVKIGDFGLSRSLMSDARLTRTGSFLGTPLYAAPEQIRADPVDQQTDVYSVAATLYFLLTGRAPHQTGDAAATMARIVSEAAPSMLATRPDLPPALDEVVLQGLERDRGRRWTSLEEFRAALLPFAPRRLPAAGRAVRLAAFILDDLFLSFLGGLIQACYAWLTLGQFSRMFAADYAQPFWLSHLGTVLWLGYFGLVEGLWGITLGKALFGLRVATARGGGPPGVARGLLRSAVFVCLFYLIWHLELLVSFPTPVDADLAKAGIPWFVWLAIAGLFLAPLSLLLPMRRHNGWRGLHEFASGTRVISVTTREQRLAIPTRRLEEELTHPAHLPERLGPYHVLGLLVEGPRGQILLGQDSGLGRKVFLWVRPVGSTAFPPEREELARGSRLRWLTKGCAGDRPWDAFVVPAGCALTDLTTRHGRLPWTEARPLLEQLTDELLAAKGDNSLPLGPRADQVWVQPDGRVCLLEFSVQPTETLTMPVAAEGVDQQGLQLLREVAVLTLEGRGRCLEDQGERVRAPVPGSTNQLLRRLCSPRQFTRLEDWHQELAAQQDWPGRVTRAARLAHLLLLSLLLGIGLSCTFLAPLFLLMKSILTPELRARQLEQAARMLRADARAAAAATANPDPLLAAVALDQVQDWLARAHRLDEDAWHRHQSVLARLRALSWPTRKLVEFALDQSAASAAVHGPDFLNAYRLGQISVSTWEEEQRAETSGDDSVQIYFLIALFPTSWILWAFLFRGGITYHLTGLALVRADGRPAARWQSGLRALLVWTPVVGLLCFSVWLDRHYVSAWTLEQNPGWALWLSWSSWWLAVVLLPTYALLAWRLPERSLHDRIVGTYLVPR